MKETKVVSTPLVKHFKLSTTQSPSTNEEKNEMSCIPYFSTVGSLMYAMVCIRPNIAHVVGTVSRFLSNPGKEHSAAVKWILRYLKDSDLGGNLDNSKSTSDYLITFGGGAISWQSRLHKCIALSTTEAEYIAITEGAKELLWMKEFIKDLDFEQSRMALEEKLFEKCGRHESCTRVPPLEVHFGPLAGGGVCWAMTHVPDKGPWPNPT
ncbi:hypothetical protein KY285_012604 [Solanum tuberosum]|nr:hypothetical protein KY285_012604 [Solanum tuberosum]